MKIVVYHSGYGCDTGCCGHVIEKLDDQGKHVEEEWTFSHDYDNEGLKWAQDLAREHFGEDHVADLDWENCLLHRW